MRGHLLSSQKQQNPESMSKQTSVAVANVRDRQYETESRNRRVWQ